MGIVVERGRGPIEFGQPARGGAVPNHGVTCPFLLPERRDITASPPLRGVCKRPAVNSPEWSRNEAKLALSKEGQTCIGPTRFPHQHIRMYMRASEICITSRTSR